MKDGWWTDTLSWTPKYNWGLLDLSNVANCKNCKNCKNSSNCKQQPGATNHERSLVWFWTCNPCQFSRWAWGLSIKLWENTTMHKRQFKNGSTQSATDRLVWGSREAKSPERGRPMQYYASNLSWRAGLAGPLVGVQARERKGNHTDSVQKVEVNTVESYKIKCPCCRQMLSDQYLLACVGWEFNKFKLLTILGW